MKELLYMLIILQYDDTVIWLMSLLPPLFIDTWIYQAEAVLELRKVLLRDWQICSVE